MLIFNPAGAWERIALSRRRWWVILIFYLVPLWVVTGAVEGWGLIHWGKPQGAVDQIKHFSPSNALVVSALRSRSAGTARTVEWPTDTASFP